MRRVLSIALALLPALAGATDITINGNTYTLASHPRGLLDGASGTITARIKDPDGAGAGVAPQATDANPAFVALKNHIQSCMASPDFCSSSSERSTTALLGAVWWYMDNSQTAALAMAEHWINNVETWITAGYQFGCDINVAYCGVSSWTDWPAQDMAFLAQAYSLIRSEMSAGERTAFAQKMFNDDVAYYQDSCDNQLQPMAGVVASYTSGSTAVTGSNLDDLTAGRLIQIRAAVGSNTYGWATIASIQSANALTLTGAPQLPLGGNASSVTNGSVQEQQPWTSSTCGLAWMLQHHPWTPSGPLNDYFQFNHTTQYGIGATSIPVSSVSGLPTPPFYVRVIGTQEVMRVTAINALTLTVERGALGTNATGAQFPPRAMQYSRYIPAVGQGDFADNKQIQKMAGYLIAGLALADDSATAAEYAGLTAQVWLNDFYTPIADLWTGFQQSGSTNYGPGRVLTWNHFMLLALKNLGGAPSLDKTGTYLIANQVNERLYGTLPDAVTQFFPWGQADIANSADYHAQIWAPLQTCLMGQSYVPSTYWNYWQRSVAGTYTAVNLTGGVSERMIPYALMCWQETDTSTDYRSVLPTQKAFVENDGNPSKSMDAWISRSGWSSSSDTLIFAEAFAHYYGVLNMGTGAPGAYKLYKQGWALTENGSRDTGSGTNSNMLLFGGAANLRATTDMLVNLDRNDSGTGWAFARINASSAYSAATAVTRAHRHLIHFKKAASPDYLVVYDSAATSSAKTIGQNQFFDKTSGQASTMNDSTVPSLQWTGPNRRMNTAVVLPSGTGVAGTYASLNDSHHVHVCASTDGTNCASVTSAEFLIVHKPSTSVSDTMPTVAALATIDADFSGVQIEDATAPSVAVFAKAGADQTSGSFTSTHSGTAQYVVTGLVAGTYDVVRGGATTVLDDEVVGTDGTLAFESTAGAFTITEGTAPPPSITITTTSLPNHVEDVAGYSQTLAYTGGTGSVTWSVTAGSLCAGLTLTGATGEIAGTPTTQQTCSFTVTATDSASPTPQTDTQDLSITITAAPPACTITTSALPNGTRQVAYSQVLASSGCTAPLSWTITSGTICTGLTLTEATGAISGTPTVVQSCPITVRLADSAAGVDTEALSITIDAPAPAVLNITTTSPLPSCVQHQPCSTTLQATGGTPPYTWTKASGTYCVGNDSLSGATLSGVPTTIETCSFTMQVEDDDSATDTQAFQRSIVNPSPSLTVQTIVGSQAVIVKFSTPAMDGSELCNVTVTDEELDDTTGLPIGPVGSAVSSQGRSTRVVTVGGLTAEHRHSVSVVCGSVASGSALFTTPAAVGGTISWKYVAVPSARLQAQSAAKLKVYYALPGEAEASSTNASCGSGCTVTLSLTSGAIYNIRHQWLTSGDAVLATTQTSPVVVP